MGMQTVCELIPNCRDPTARADVEQDEFVTPQRFEQRLHQRGLVVLAKHRGPSDSDPPGEEHSPRVGQYRTLSPSMTGTGTVAESIYRPPRGAGLLLWHYAAALTSSYPKGRRREGENKPTHLAYCRRRFRCGGLPA